jgi:hypothetical protein
MKHHLDSRSCKLASNLRGSDFCKQEEFCEENFAKTCQITFEKQAYNETVRDIKKNLVIFSCKS